MEEDIEQGISSPDLEKEIVSPLRRSFCKSSSPPSIWRVLQYADSIDIVFMVLGSFCCFLNGLRMPIATLLFGKLTDVFGTSQTEGPHHVIHIASKLCLQFLSLGAGASVASFIGTALWMCSGERQALRMRRMYVDALIRQDISFFDERTASENAVGNISEDATVLQEALGDKASKFVEMVGTFIGGFAVAFGTGWKLALVMAAPTPLLFLIGILTSFCASKASMVHHHFNQEATAIVEETLSAVKTVASFNGEEQAVNKYAKSLKNAYIANAKQALTRGLGMGCTHLITFCIYALALWYGSNLVLNDGYTGGKIMTVIFAVVNSGSSLIQVSPCINAFAEGRAAASKMIEVIERKPTIPIDNREGIMLTELKGDIQLQNICFSYPARPNFQIFSGFSIEIQSEITTALVGESGSGKSTIIGLIERFYDPQCGEVLIDNHDIRKFRLNWLRHQIGLVSQEPVLFGTTIRDNIAYGKDGASLQEIEMAADFANATKFIKMMPEGFETAVGEHGTQLSGGQKQRIAIARAVLRNPKILLLDEATSALDAESERIVRDAFNKLRGNRTTVVVAHRLTTIRNANVIVVLQHGSIVEKGTHEELIRISNGLYSRLVRLQETKEAEDQPSEDFDKIKPFHSSEIQACCERLNEDRSNEESTDVDKAAGDFNKTGLRGLYCRLISLSKEETPILIFGSFSGAVNGIILPLFGLLLGRAIKALFEAPYKLQKDCDFWSLVSVLLGVAALLFTPSQMLCFAVAGSKLVRRVKVRLLENILCQEISWFDRSENNSGRLSTKLATDAGNVHSIVGDPLALVAQNLACIVAALVISFRASWEFSLVIMVLLPLIGLQVWAQAKLAKGFNAKIQMMYEDASQLVSEAVRSIRTVASLCAEQKIINLYNQLCNAPSKNLMKKGVLLGLGVGATNLLMFGAYSLIFWIGGHLIADQKTSFDNLFTVFFSLLMCAIGISQTISVAPQLSKLKASMISIFKILDRKSNIDPDDESGLTLENVRGHIAFCNVWFRYPTRPNVQIFQGLSLSVPPGKVVALVGESGSGKSTIISLLQRFYEVDSGNILVDGIDIRKMPLKWLRQQMGVVGQEPVLFEGTIRSNIAYGCCPNKEEEMMEGEIIQVAKLCNAHKFICSLPSGYDTYVGSNGVNLSGGQKQRIAIARAIIRRPSILLLDEATSALDAESEGLVQEALENVIVQRSTIMIAHRLSTIRNAEIIAVVQNGVIAERGSHSDLISMPNGFYASLLRYHAGSPS